MTPEPSPANKPGVWLDSSQYAAEQAELRQLREAQRQQREEQERQESERLQLVVKQGQAEKALQSIEENWKKKHAEEVKQRETIANRYLSEKVNAAINEALAGRTFAGSDPQSVASMVRSLLSNEVEAVFDANNEPVVRHKGTLRPASEYLKERLDAPDSQFSIFFAATNKGGSGAAATQPVGAQQKPQADNPNLVFAREFLARKEAARNALFG